MSPAAALLSPAVRQGPPQDPPELWVWLGLVVVALVLVGVAVGLAVAAVRSGGFATMLRGETERWPLSRAIEALRIALRRAARPGTVWVAGLVFPSVQLHGWIVTSLSNEPGDARQQWLFGRPIPVIEVSVPAEGIVWAAFAFATAALLSIPIGLLVIRLNAGLARIAVPARWRAASRERRGPTLRSVWTEGRGLVIPAAGLWVAHVCLASGAVALLLGPLVLVLSLVRGSGSTVPATALGTILVLLGALLAVYLLVLQVLQQLALQSLARNRRGMASALIHAWRLLQNDPWAAVRASLGELGLNLAHAVVGAITFGIGWFVLLPVTGVARAIYWAEVYPELGGLGAEDGVPGLAPA
jgi:hypothetical protein